MIEIFSDINLAFLEGVFLAFSPCILPVLPLILASSSIGNKYRSLFIIGGFIASFTIFTLSAREILSLTGVKQENIQFASFLLLLMLGLVIIIPAFSRKFMAFTYGLANKAEHASSSQKIAESSVGAFLTGALIGVVWIPCAGPILAAALLQVIKAETNLNAVITVFAFSIGAGVPMLLIALFGQGLGQYLRKLNRYTEVLRYSMGIIIIVFSLFGLFEFNIGEVVIFNSTVEKEINLNRLKEALSEKYKAAEFKDIEKWFNSTPLKMEDLRGKVVLVDFWTYSCINCVRTLPHIKEWYSKYHDKGFVVVGVHSPEFAFEAEAKNVEKAIEKFAIEHPVAMDNQFSTWYNYNNEYWPAHYLIDKEGNVVYVHYGEGEYDTTENNIRYLLGLNDEYKPNIVETETSSTQTPETYLGTLRADGETTKVDIPLDSWKLEGDWKREGEYIESISAGAKITINYRAKNVFLVMESLNGSDINVNISNGNNVSLIQVNNSDLYKIVENDEAKQSLLTITAEKEGLRLYAFTFGS